MVNMSLDEKIEMYRNGFRLDEKPGIAKLSGVCSGSPIANGDTHPITVSVDGTNKGTPPYTYSATVDGAAVEGSPSASSTAATYTFNHVFGEGAGDHTVIGTVTDSCQSAAVTDSCTITISGGTPGGGGGGSNMLLYGGIAIVGLYFLAK